MNSVSVIVPSYNCEKYIREAIQSILNQTHEADEIIVIDDGSTDNTKTIVAGFNNKKIKYIYQSNAGVSAARNNGIGLAKGEYIAFLDADDRWLPTMLEEQVNALDCYPSLVFCATNFIRFMDGTGERLPEQFSLYPELKNLKKADSASGKLRISAGDAFSSIVGFGEFPAFTSAMLFRKSLLSGLLFDCNLKICEDAEFVLRLSVRGRGAFNSNVLMEMRRHETNATSNWSGIAIDKLKALLTLREFTELDSKQKEILDKRLVKAHIDAAVSLIRTGKKGVAWSYYFDSMRIRGSLFRKSKGCVRVLMELLKECLRT
jgi:glycosyltransferase involved in cell wall biosynthesis